MLIVEEGKMLPGELGTHIAATGLFFLWLPLSCPSSGLVGFSLEE